MTVFLNSTSADYSDSRKATRVKVLSVLGNRLVSDYEIRFYSLAIDAMPDKILSTLITHELCHIYTPTTPAFKSASEDGLMNVEYEEDLNCGIVIGRGFEEYELDIWPEENRERLLMPPEPDD